MAMAMQQPDAEPSGLSECAAPPARQLWSSTGDALPPTTDKPPTAPIEPTPSKRPPSVEPPLSKQATHLFTLSYLVFFSIFGTLARLGLEALTFYPGAPVVTGIIWANVGGSLLMGFFLEDKNLFREEWGQSNNDEQIRINNNNDIDDNDPAARERLQAASKNHKAVKKTIPLYIGLTTGFCGSFTSFSSFIRDIFLALTNDLPNPSSPAGTPIPPRNGGYSFMALLAVLLSTVALSLAALMAGAHLALALDSLTPTVPFRLTRRLLDPLFVFLAWGAWLGAVLLSIWPPDRSPGPDTWRGRALFSCVFAPLGCLLRFYVSLLLNPRLPTFPLGTFTVNVFGSAVLAMCFDLQHVEGIGATAAAVSAASTPSAILIGCQVLQGIMDGFCGCATTVSTWVAELTGLSRRRHAYLYGVASVAVALGFFVVITGSLSWTRGLVNPVCS
ncbi:Fluc/FEX family fluoride channel [Aspergillus clavatus NRRL 1]|uniref:Chromosome condensation protein, putative n=1 Tax=Aspergillus clavatus (strain ATCC 1007 / CBS 513.65 / DSM 816 / NCTC 3887 / NRRL 1 / QM 1276 / 107) TaxID=344612 RepID=A1C7V8_ASPCL|nr:chromosome condensation protein, putative [Aspergillus clavatus NRRL 1]EAW14479.1 chromosome condensation protein, putative [Aspergillus clavatus NRRL 1]